MNDLMRQRKRLLDLADQGYDVSTEARLLDDEIDGINDDMRAAAWDRHWYNRQEGSPSLVQLPNVSRGYFVPTKPRTFGERIASAHAHLVKAARIHRLHHDLGAAAFCLKHAARLRRLAFASRELFGPKGDDDAGR